MDALLEVLDPLVLDKFYASVLPRTTPFTASEFSNNTSYASSHIDPDSFFYSEAEFASAWGRDHLYRQVSSCLIVAGFGAAVLYSLFSALSYYLIYDRRLEHHPRFLKNQVRQEIISSLIAIPVIDVLTLPFFLGEVRGHSLLYTNISDYGWPWLVVSTLIYMIFNDLGIYWIHRLEHHPSIYKYVHKPHHKWIIPTPWASFAFHPLDGWAQSLPYHVFVYVCPMQKHLYMFLFVVVQVWTVLIHDGDMITGHWLEKFINSPAHHTLHHMYFTCNYGQYFTWADNYFDSHRAPRPELDPINEAIKAMHAKGLVDEKGNPVKKSKSA